MIKVNLHSNTHSPNTFSKALFRPSSPHHHRISDLVADLAIFDRQSVIPHSRRFPSSTIHSGKFPQACHMFRSLKLIHFYSLQVNPLFQPPIPLPIAPFHFRLKPFILRLYDLSIQYIDQSILFTVSFVMSTLPARYTSLRQLLMPSTARPP